jgi:hypothetical protein
MSLKVGGGGLIKTLQQSLTIKVVAAMGSGA